jgi:hypothetical protein
LIDDGGHTAEQQKITLEEMLPFLNPGGVYICEDIHRKGNKFNAFSTALIDELYHFKTIPDDIVTCEMSNFQKSIHSIHAYPYVLVIEKNISSPGLFTSKKHGTIWQPF